MKNRKSLLLIGLGSINILHAGLHIVQFVQSLMLVSKSAHSDTDNPWWSLLWAVVGLLTLYVGIKDFRHHNHCHDEKDKSQNGH